MHRVKTVVVITFLFTSFSIFAHTNDSAFFAVKSIHIQGNKKTKDFIILRELTFKVGDTLQSVTEHLVQSRKQLINLFLFNSVELTAQDSIVQVKLIERWYYWPFPILDYADRNFNQWWLSRDFKRLIYGIDFTAYNLGGKNQTLKINALGGYTKLIGFSYRMPYFNRSKTWGLELSSSYKSNREVWYKTMDDKVQFFRDNDLTLIKNWDSEIRFTHRKKIFNYHHIYTGFRYTQVSDTVLTKSVNELFLLNKQNTQREIILGYDFVRDKRDYKGYPLKGHYFKAIANVSRFYGKKTSMNSTMLKLTFSKYFQLSPKFYFSSQINGRFYQMATSPYTRIQALGYNKDYVRGYELNVIDGQNFALFKSEFKYKFFDKIYPLARKLYGYENMPISVYLTTYFDDAFVSNSRDRYELSLNNQLPNKNVYGFGTGLNFVMFYDYVVRTEYSFKKNGNARWFLSFVASM
jgi:outer membrane protein assembly factor BamA